MDQMTVCNFKRATQTDKPTRNYHSIVTVYLYRALSASLDIFALQLLTTSLVDAADSCSDKPTVTANCLAPKSRPS